MADEHESVTQCERAFRALDLHRDLRDPGNTPAARPKLTTLR